MPLNLITARRVLRAVHAGMPVEPALQIVEQCLDGYDDIENLETLMKRALEGNHVEVEILCKRMRGEYDGLETYEDESHG